MGIPAVPPPMKRTGTAVEPVSNRVKELRAGEALATVDEEVDIHVVYITNDAGTELIGYKKTVTMTDDTADSEDTVIKEYRLINGTLTEII